MLLTNQNMIWPIKNKWVLRLRGAIDKVFNWFFQYFGFDSKGAGGLVDGKTDGLILSPKPVLEWLKLGVPARNMCNYLPSKFESFRKHTLSSSWTSWTGGILRVKIML